MMDICKFLGILSWTGAAVYVAYCILFSNIPTLIVGSPICAALVYVGYIYWDM